MPAWGGAEAGLPGTAYAKILRDVASGASPVVSYWKQALIESDNRIAAMESDTSTYAFSAPAAGGTVTIDVAVRFRRVFQELMDAKGWQTPDILMERVQVQVIGKAWWGVYLPLMLH